MPSEFDPVAEYGNDRGQVDTGGLLSGIGDWRAGNLTVEETHRAVARIDVNSVC